MTENPDNPVLVPHPLDGGLPPVPEAAVEGWDLQALQDAGFDWQALARSAYAAGLRDAERIARNAAPADNSQMTFVGGKRRAWALIRKRRLQVLGMIP